MPPTHVAHDFPKTAVCPKLYAFGIRQFGKQTERARTVCSSRFNERMAWTVCGGESLAARDGRPLPLQAQQHKSGLLLISNRQWLVRLGQSHIVLPKRILKGPSHDCIRRDRAKRSVLGWQGYGS
jgi:hypothetical protein